MTSVNSQTQASLRAEHDGLARRLEVRPSVDRLRSGLLVSFVGLVSFGISWALVSEVWAKEPSALALAHHDLLIAAICATAALAAVLFVRGALVLRSSRRMAREEATLFARLCELRRALEIDG